MLGGHIETVELLLENGSDVHVQALIYAASQEYIEILKLLIDNGSDVNASNNLKQTPLMYAAMSGKSESVQFLIDHGADINATDIHSKTALTYAKEWSRIRVIILLEQNGAREFKDEERKDTIDYNKLFNAAKDGEVSHIVVLFLDGADLKTKDEDGNTILILASKYGHMEIVQFLITKMDRDTIQSKNNEGKSALDYAVENNHTEIVELLKEKGATQKGNFGIEGLLKFLKEKVLN